MKVRIPMEHNFSFSCASGFDDVTGRSSFDD